MEKKKLITIVNTKNLISTALKDKKLSFQAYLKTNQLEKSLELFVKSVHDKIESLKKEYDIMANEMTTKVTMLEGKKISELTDEEKKIVTDWNDFNVEYNKMINEEVDYEKPFTLTELMSAFKEDEIFSKNEMDNLLELLGI